jgi:hypothetical protein
MNLRPQSTRDLRPTERRFVVALQQIGYGRLEFLRIQRGELVLDPWPTTVRHVKFGSARQVEGDKRPGEFDLKKQLADFFEHVRALDECQIRVLEVQAGLPYSMQIEDRCGQSGGVANE